MSPCATNSWSLRSLEASVLKVAVPVKIPVSLPVSVSVTVIPVPSEVEKKVVLTVWADDGSVLASTSETSRVAVWLRR